MQITRCPEKPFNIQRINRGSQLTSKVLHPYNMSHIKHQFNKQLGNKSKDFGLTDTSLARDETIFQYVMRQCLKWTKQ